MFTKSVSHGVCRCVKDGSFLRQAWSESQWTVLMGYRTISTNVRRYHTHHRWHFFLFQEDSALVHMHCACNTVQLLRRSRLPFSWTMPPNSPELNALITRFRQSYCSVSISRESKRLKKPRSDWLNSGNALIHHLSEKNAIFVFRRFAR